jgi:CheY-like chemotaxis protein
LTGGVAHDFNNLLAVIMSNAEILQTRLGQHDPLTQAVIRAAQRGSELTQRLLAFSRQQSLDPQIIDLDALVANMTGILGRTLGAEIEIKTEPAKELWQALADPGQMENALLNLAINARDAMPQGGKLTIEIANAHLDRRYAAAHAEVEPGDYVMAAVGDTGHGMAPKVLTHVFEPFFTTKEVGRGSGLGLSMVYGFIKQSNGHIVIDSKQGLGTTVRLYLPRAETGNESAQPGRASIAEDPAAHGEAVLVVEDEFEVRQSTVALLEALGYQVLQAPDGESALTTMDQSPRIDLLLSDVVLPGGMSGPDLAAEIRRREPGIKVLFMSGYAEAAARGNGVDGHGTKLLNKPFRKSDLARKVRAALDP